MQEKLNTFAVEHDLSADEAVQQAQEFYIQVAARYQEARQEHPELNEFFAKAEALYQKALEEKHQGDEAGFEALMEQYREVQKELEEKVEGLPDLQYLADQLEMAERTATLALAEAAGAVNAEGKKLAEEFQELREDIEALLQSQDEL